MLLVIVLMLVASAFFSGAEIAFVTANRLRAEVRVRQAGALGRVVQGFMADPATLLTTTLVGNNVALVVYSTLMSEALAPPLTSFFTGPVGLASAGGAVLVAQTVVAALVVLVIGEVVPKSLLRQPPGGVLVALAAPLKFTYWLFWPLIKLAGWTSGLLVRLVGTPADSLSQFLRRDFEILIRESRQTGSLRLDEEESEILSNVFELRTLRVKDSMIPRTDICAVAETASLDAVRQTFVETGFSRLPVYRDTLDHVVGVVLAHDLFHAPASLSAIVRPARVVPETKPAKDLLFSFLRETDDARTEGGSRGLSGGTAASLAVVVDEHGGTAGIVTLEDLLEELFGDIRDEHDVAATPIRRLDDRTLLVHGRVELEELAGEAGVALPEGDYDTVGGYLLARVGRVPAERDSFDLDGFRFTVVKASASRVETVRVERLG